MLNDNNTGLMRCKTVEVGTLDSITQIPFSHNRCRHLMLAQGHNVSVSTGLPLVPLHATDNVYGERTKKKRSVSCDSRKQSG